MNRTLGWLTLAVMVAVLAAPAVVLGAEEADPPPAAGGESVNTPKAFGIVGACLGAGLSAFGGGIAIARIGGNSIDAIARQPEASGAMFAPMVVTAAMIEGGMLFAMVVCLLGVLSVR